MESRGCFHPYLGQGSWLAPHELHGALRYRLALVVVCVLIAASTELAVIVVAAFAGPNVLLAFVRHRNFFLLECTDVDLRPRNVLWVVGCGVAGAEPLAVIDLALFQGFSEVFADLVACCMHDVRVCAVERCQCFVTDSDFGNKVISMFDVMGGLVL